MTDKDLDNLMEEMVYRTPLRDKIESKGTVPTEKRVLISDPSITKSNVEYEEDREVMPFSIASTNLNQKDSDLAPESIGTSSSDNRDIKKYKLLLIDDQNSICGTVMGQGITFCSDFKCRVNHRGDNERVTFREGQLYVAQSKTRAFLKPTLLSDNIDEDIIEKWLDTSQTLQE